MKFVYCPDHMVHSFLERDGFNIYARNEGFVFYAESESFPSLQMMLSSDHEKNVMLWWVSIKEWKRTDQKQISTQTWIMVNAKHLLEGGKWDKLVRCFSPCFIWKEVDHAFRKEDLFYFVYSRRVPVHLVTLMLDTTFQNWLSVCYVWL